MSLNEVLLPRDVNHFPVQTSIFIEKDEHALLRESREGNETSFGILVRRYQGNLYRLAASLVGPGTEAEDIVADAFVKAWRHIDRFRGESRFKTWLFRILINLARSHLRHRYLHRRLFFWNVPAKNDDNDAPETQWCDPSPGADPEKCVERKKLQCAVRRAKEALSPREHEVFSLKFEENMKISEISTLLSLSQNTVKVLLFRAAKKMAAALKDYNIDL